MAPSYITKSTLVVALISAMGSPSIATMSACPPMPSTHVPIVNPLARNLSLAASCKGRILDPMKHCLIDDDSQASGAATNASTRRSKVGWMMGAKPGL